VNKTEEDVAKGYSVGAVDYIVKPFDPEALRAKVSVLAALHQRNEIVRPDRLAAAQTDLSLLIEQETHSGCYRHLANAIPQIVWIARPEGTIDFFNQPWFKYTGLTFEQSEGWGWKKVLHPEDLQSALDKWVEALRVGRDYHAECRLKRADGTYRWHLVRAFPERDPQGQILAWLGTSTDVNDQKQTQENLQRIIHELEQKKGEAETATRLKSEFVSNVSHELRTPLNAILGYASLVLEGTYGEIPEHLKNPVDGIQRNAFELLELINNLLDLSKIESGRMPLVIESIDLGSLLPRAAEKVDPLLNGKKVAIQWRIEENLRHIQSDPLRVRQIFMNLLTNAIKFTEEGLITISAANVERGVLLSIEDTGIGIKEEDLPAIFDVFRQIDGSTTRKAGGSGLGLTIVKNILEVLHGTINVRSEFGKGSTFTVFLPERPTDPNAAPAETPQKTLSEK
ncbi:MAG: PAS domain S-box protein, partial [Candidatus Manganitrophaceae bacterium]